MNAFLSPTPERLMQLAWGYAPTLIIHAAVQHRVFDQLAQGSSTLERLVEATGASVRGLRAILDALVGLQLLWRTESGEYALTPESTSFLVSSSPEYRGALFWHHAQQLLPQWMQLESVVRTGRPAARTNRQPDGAEHFAGFVESLFPGGYPAARALGEHLGVARAASPLSVLDVGAGSGVWGIALAELSRWVRVRAVDWPRVLEITRQVAARHGVADRLTLVGGDFFEADFGGGHQIATLGHILHSEGPVRVGRLLRKTWEALAPGGVAAIQEFIPNDERTGPTLPLLFAVNMLVNTEAGSAYTYGELRQWLEEAGYVRVRLLEVPAVSPLVLADKPS